MVLQKRLYYGFEGYQAPPVPRANRSLRRRGPLIRKKVVDNQMCAFDLLATVADKILLEGKSPGTASSDRIFKEGSNLGIVKEEQLLDDHKLLNIESCNQSNVEIGLVVVECGSKAQNQPCREITKHQSGFSSGSASAITTSSCMAKAGFDEKKALNNGSSQSGSLLKKLERSSSGYTVFSVPVFGDHGKKQFQSHISEASYGVGSDTCSSEDPKLSDRNLSASAKHDTDAKVPVHGNRYTCDFPSPCRNNVNVVTKDDDDNSSECSQRSTVMKTIADRRIRKLLASRCWRAPPKASSGDVSNIAYQNRKRGSKCQRSQRIYPFKKRKLLYTSPSTSDDTTRCDYEDIYEPLEKATDMPTSGFGVSARKATSELSGAAGQSTLFASRESNVKLRIKSFRVPELFIELPETATVGSLKKTVMDAITTLLGGGLRVGVLVQGRKIRDDNRTLLQTGISHDNKVDTLGFTLEPNPSRVITQLCSEEPSVEVLRPLSSSYSESSIERGAADSKALIAVPEPNEQPLALVTTPLHKSKRSEAAQRRIRRPFSVAEVEALVQAVEKLGTGRWRDVKIRAFDDVDHRTYVDLKDKWKTLVHTATISPQQRRGEPVPQDLLDRVLAAHSYWSLQHAKQQPERCLLV